MNKGIVFNLKFTASSPNKNWSKAQKDRWAEDRRFYSLRGVKNLYDYVSTEAKIQGELEKINSLAETDNAEQKDYLSYSDKGQGVFNLDGFLTDEQGEELKQSAQKSRGNIWHGFISFPPEEREQMDSPEKAQEFIKKTFPTFLKNSGLNKDKLDMFFGLHLDRNHAHIHFQFWENEPMFRNSKTGKLNYRTKGTIDDKIIENYKITADMYFSENRDELGNARDEAVKTLRGTKITKMEIGRLLTELSDKLPTDGRLSYNSPNMKALRPDIDKIVDACIKYSPELRECDLKFKTEYEKRRQEVLKFSKSDNGKTLIEEDEIDYLNKIKSDYKARLGNAVIRLARFNKNARTRDLLKDKKGYRPTAKPNDRLKKSRAAATLHMTERSIDLMLKDMLSVTGGKADFSFDLIRAKWEIAQGKKSDEDKDWVDKHS